MLLLDENLSFRLVRLLDDVFPGVRQVTEVGLERANDDVIWRWASDHNCAIVSKDDDFRQRAQYFGAPPKVIWLRVGNCPTKALEEILRTRHGEIESFLADPETAMLILRR